jgi:2-polyprenyl-3-methyl-5-hydroxy-6-metoxy-1,4-benzoquinol methylase
MKTNKDLQKIYNKIFKNGERKTFTPFLAKGKRTTEVEEILKTEKWKRKSVLEVGCGTGFFAYSAAKKGGNVLAIDYSAEAIKIAQNNYQHQGLVFKKMDAKNIKGQYDLIVSIGTLEHMDNPLKMLEIFKKHLNKNGRIIITCPNWVNPRGYILMALYFLFDAPITLADLHYLTPMDFVEFSRKLKMTLRWRTFDRAWSHGSVLIDDFKRRIPNVLRDAKLLKSKKNIEKMIDWLEKKVLPLNNNLYHSGAIGLYIFGKK